MAIIKDGKVTKAPARNFYHNDDVKRIPILDVCAHLGLQVQKRGKSYKTKIRNEKTPSTVIHPEPESNSFYDFGTQEHGDVIYLVQCVCNLSYPDAITYLGDAFGLEPISQDEKKRYATTMGVIDYERIGLYADRATKNFTFPVETCTIEQLERIEQKYSMSMNELHKKHPRVYERIINERAVPYVNRLRNAYYFDIWNHYKFLESLGMTSLFYDSEKTQARFSAQTKELEQVEVSLSKAVRGTSIELDPPHKYDPMRVVSHMLQGQLIIRMGSHLPSQLEDEAKENKQKICAVKITYNELFRDPLDEVLAEIPHCISINSAQAKINCLERDYALVRSTVQTMRNNSWAKAQLNELIGAASTEQTEKNMQSPVPETALNR